MAAGLAGISALASFLASDGMRNPATTTLAVSVAAACGGFLIWNFAPAKLFMGDAGSTLLGFSIAFLTLDFYRSRPASLPVALFPFFFAALPLLDFTLAIARRLRRGRSVIHGDRGHIYDVLLARGWRCRNVATVFFGLSSVLAGLGWLALLTARTIFLLVGATIMAGVLTAVILLGSPGHSENSAGSEAGTPEVIGSRS